MSQQTKEACEARRPCSSRQETAPEECAAAGEAAPAAGGVRFMNDAGVGAGCGDGLAGVRGGGAAELAFASAFAPPTGLAIEAGSPPACWMAKYVSTAFSTFQPHDC